MIVEHLAMRDFPAIATINNHETWKDTLCGVSTLICFHRRKKAFFFGVITKNVIDFIGNSFAIAT